MEKPDWTCKIDEGLAGLTAVRWSPDGRHILSTADFQVRLQYSDYKVFQRLHQYLMPESHVEDGCQGTWGWSHRPLTQEARTPQKPALPATQLQAPPTLPEAGSTRSDGGLWPINHSLQRSRPEAPNPSSKKCHKRHIVPATLIDRKP